MPPSDPKRSDRPKAGLLETITSSPLQAPEPGPGRGAPTLGSTIVGGPAPGLERPAAPRRGTLGSTLLGGSPAELAEQSEPKPKPKPKPGTLGSTMLGGPPPDPAPAAPPGRGTFGATLLGAPGQSREVAGGPRAKPKSLGSTIPGGPAPTQERAQPRRAKADLGSTIAGGPAPTSPARSSASPDDVETRERRTPPGSDDELERRHPALGERATLISTRDERPASAKRSPAGSQAHDATMIGGLGGVGSVEQAPGAERPPPPDRTMNPAGTGTVVRGADMRSSAMEQTILGSGPPPESVMRSKLDAEIFTTPGQPGKIHRFTVLRVLGEGGMGVVYAAYDEELDRRVAIKLVRDDLHEGTHGRSRMLREAQAMARVSHPNVVQVYEVGEFAGQVFVAMEFVKGTPLTDWVAAEERDWQELRDMFVQAGRGLAAAHEQGLVHRDFKPDNVLVGNDGRARVLDFGLARAEGAGLRSTAGDSMLMSSLGTTNSAFDTKLTMVGTIMGTPAYMSPEQHEGAPTGAPSDQFSLCVALYEALYGQQPFPGETYQALAESVTSGDLTPPPRGTDVPDWLFEALKIGMAVDPEQRHPSMDTLLAELSQDSTPALTRSRWLWPGVTAFAVVTAVLVTLGLVGQGEPSAEELARIQSLEESARDAAERKLWVYPADGNTDDTAYRRIAQLEELEGDAGVAGGERAKELRIDFADQLVVLGDKYYEDDSTRPFARDYYIQALVFQPDSPRALERAGMTPGQLADIRERANESEFGEAELFAAEALTVLASADDQAIADGLADLQDRAEFGSASSKLVMGPVIERLGGAKAKQKLLAANQPDPAADSGAPPRGSAVELDSDAADSESADSGEDDTADEAEAPAAVKAAKPRNTGGKGPKSASSEDSGDSGGGDEADGEPVYDPVKSMELTREAEAARRRGALSEAEQLYNQALGSWNRNAAALMGLSDIHFDRGAFDRAVKFANQAVRAEPKNGDYRLRLGDAYFKVLRYNDARRSYEKADEYGNKKAKDRIKRVREKTGE